MSTQTANLKLTQPQIGDAISSTIPALATNFGTIDTEFGQRGANVMSPVYGAKGDGTTDDTAAIQAAINAVSNNGGGIVFFPAGTYRLATITQSANGYLENYFLSLPSNVTLMGVGADSVLKVGDHIFDQAVQGNNAHILEGYAINNVTIRNLKFDMNGANNLTPSGYTRNAMAIRVANGGTNIRIEDNFFINCPGNNVIALNVNGQTGSIAFIANNTFQNGGRYVGTSTENTNNTDFTFVYTEWNNSIVTNNHIEQQNIDIAMHNFTGGIELHGSNSKAVGNTIIGCDPAVWVASAPNAIANVLVSNNIMRDCMRGVSFWLQNAMQNVLVKGNSISLNHSSLRVSTDLCYGVQMPNGSSSTFSSSNANGTFVQDLVVEGNNITCNLPNNSTYVARGMDIHSMHGASIVNNIIDGMSDVGIMLEGTPWGNFDITIERNAIFNCGFGTTNIGNKTGVYLNINGSSTTPAQSFTTKNLYIRDNVFGNTHNETYDGSGNLTAISCAGNQWVGVTVASLSSTTKVERLFIERNKCQNLLYYVYGGSNPQTLESQNAEAHWIPDVIYSQTNTLASDIKFFGNEIVNYLNNGSMYQCTQQGNITSKTGTATGTSGSNSVTVDSTTGMRVGMFINLTGAGSSGATLYTYVTSIVDSTHITVQTALSTSVTNASYSFAQPTLNLYRPNSKTGSSTIAASATTATVNHGLPSTPSFVDATPEGNVGSVWITNITSSQFTVNCSTAPASATTFVWKAQL